MFYFIRGKANVLHSAHKVRIRSHIILFCSGLKPLGYILCGRLKEGVYSVKVGATDHPRRCAALMESLC